MQKRKLTVGKFKFDKIFVLIFILISGNIPLANLLFVLNKSYLFLGFTFLLLFNILNQKKRIQKKEFYYFSFIIIAQIVLTAFQGLKGTNISANIITQFVLFTMAFLLSINFRSKLFTYIPEIVVLVIKLSLLFHIPAVILYILGINILDIIPDFLKFHNSMDFDADKTHVIFHNYRAFAIGDTEKWYRNSGCFWEPGAFGGVIVFASLWFIAGFKSYLPKKRKQILFWLIIGIASTQSSAALMLLPVLAILYQIEKRKDIRQLKKFIYIGVPVILVLFYIMFTNLPVLQEKIVEQFISVQEEEKFWERTRLGTIIILIVVIKDNPLLGVGFGEHGFSNALYQYLGSEMEGLGNGMFIYISKAGIPFFILITLLFYNNFRKMYMKNISAIIAIFILLLALQGEDWMGHPIIYLFLFSSNSLIKENQNLKTKKHYMSEISVQHKFTQKSI
jgi:hypothetical protein